MYTFADSHIERSHIIIIIGLLNSLKEDKTFHLLHWMLKAKDSLPFFQFSLPNTQLMSEGKLLKTENVYLLLPKVFTHNCFYNLMIRC